MNKFFTWFQSWFKNFRWGWFIYCLIIFIFACIFKNYALAIAAVIVEIGVFTIHFLNIVKSRNILDTDTQLSAPQITDAIDTATEAVQKCRNILVVKRFAELRQQLLAYIENNDADQTVINRINSYYLPTLENALSNLSIAEKRKSKKTGKLVAPFS